MYSTDLRSPDLWSLAARGLYCLDSPKPARFGNPLFRSGAAPDSGTWQNHQLRLSSGTLTVPEIICA
ncbi:hypothetical protein N7468_006035 [Penicillium chermesinum]|uniref:Uncharacterized protein n=1 Tax=Penicillium chermesinum TaxID=63820 RepID=A0A9W9TQ95_9EURO|nr:uncharacterized protein N7468_006035 [Penicillium chermesinum]KAJ5233079.1 hypothetical protein N7468_006035 [Penicillium chermesinum]